MGGGRMPPFSPFKYALVYGYCRSSTKDQYHAVGDALRRRFHQRRGQRTMGNNDLYASINQLLRAQCQKLHIIIITLLLLHTVAV
jgi:hypothetical protein